MSRKQAVIQTKNINPIFQKTYFGKYPNHPLIISFVQSKLSLTYDDLRCSKRLNKVINKVIYYLMNSNELMRLVSPVKQAQSSSGKVFPSGARSTLATSWGLHLLTIRLDLLKQLLIHQLCIPRLYEFLGVGTIDNTVGESHSNSILSDYWTFLTGRSGQLSGKSSSPDQRQTTETKSNSHLRRTNSYGVESGWSSIADEANSSKKKASEMESLTGSQYLNILERAKGIIIEAFSLFLISEEGNLSTG